MLLKIKNALNNESGGPNLESLIGLGVSLGVIAGLYAVANAAYIVIYKLSGFVTAYEL